MRVIYLQTQEAEPDPEPGKGLQAWKNAQMGNVLAVIPKKWDWFGHLVVYYILQYPTGARGTQMMACPSACLGILVSGC